MPDKPNRFRFRAWDGQDGKMLYSDDWSAKSIGVCFSGDVIWCDEECNDRVILMQSTGLADSKGVEIFEGDVCEHGVVVWKDGAMGLDTGSATYVPGGLRADRTRHWTIIGNIHGNPELVQ